MKAPAWKICFWGLLGGYGLYYAPYGINETDGGFITGLAWQLLNGKSLYAEVVYVRPPVPVWLRALELKVLPEPWAVLAERWIFFGKVALYSWLGAAMLARGQRRWALAALAFVMSVHCYPPAAWHTIDGILFGALSLWFLSSGRGVIAPVFSGISMAACLLCKQSFYPMMAVWIVFLWAYPKGKGAGLQTPALYKNAAGAFSCSLAVFLFYLYQNDALAAFWELTNGAASGGQAVQHGLLDYFQIKPVLAGISVALLAPVVWWFWRRRAAGLAFATWIVFLLTLGASYGWTIWQREEYTVPFAQTRILFWVAALWGIYRYWGKTWGGHKTACFYALLALSWCASVSWGYNLPILFALPWVYAVYDLSRALWKGAFPARRIFVWSPAVVLAGLLGLFRLGYAQVYRDGPRGEMTVHLGDIFPRLRGIYSNAATAALYRELRELSEKYGPNVKTLPSFPHANYLTQTRPPLPLDWVVEREMQAGKKHVLESLKQQNVVLLIEKAYGARLNTDPELALTMECLIKGKIVEETPHFWVLKPNR